MFLSPSLQLTGTLGRLACIGAPAVLMQLITFMMMSVDPIDICFDAVEYFAGEQAVPFTQMEMVSNMFCLFCFI